MSRGKSLKNHVALVGQPNMETGNAHTGVLSMALYGHGSVPKFSDQGRLIPRASLESVRRFVTVAMFASRLQLAAVLTAFMISHSQHPPQGLAMCTATSCWVRNRGGTGRPCVACARMMAGGEGRPGCGRGARRCRREPARLRGSPGRTLGAGASAEGDSTS